jgi:hypothetical protein
VKTLDGVVQLLLGVGLIAAIVYGCSPARPDEVYERACARHLTLCPKCRAEGYTAAALASLPTGSPCFSFGPRHTMHSASSTR